MADMLTQEEINALLAGDSNGTDELDGADLLDESPSSDHADLSHVLEDSAQRGALLTMEQKDALGEIGNISMGTATTTLYQLLNQKVLITTPKVSEVDWKTLSASYERPCVGIRVSYTEGLKGTNILILRDRDVKIITNLMMGGEGHVEEPIELEDIDLSAIQEAMNQMVGSSSTSLSSMIKQKIDIDTPQAFMLDFGDESFFESIGFKENDVIVCVAFKMEIGTLIDSEIMQVVPLEFAKDMVDKMMGEMLEPDNADIGGDMAGAAVAPPPAQAPPIQQQMQQMPQMQPQDAAYAQQQAYAQQPGYAPPPNYVQQPGYAPPPAYAPPPGYQQPAAAYPGYPQSGQIMPGMSGPSVSAQPAQFQSLDISELAQQKENIGIIMDVPLEVTVELGRTKKRIREILEFAPGTVVDLDKIAGEPIDILVNGKFVATGEVVVVDENFAVRVTDIISVEKRI